MTRGRLLSQAVQLHKGKLDASGSDVGTFRENRIEVCRHHELWPAAAGATGLNGRFAAASATDGSFLPARSGWSKSTCSALFDFSAAVAAGLVVGADDRWAGRASTTAVPATTTVQARTLEKTWRRPNPMM